MAGKRWSEFLQGGAGAEGDFMDEDGREQEEDEEEDEEGEVGSLQSMQSMQSHVSFASLPSYMRSKSGFEMDPDRYRRRKQMIWNLPEAASAKRQLQQVAISWDPKKKTPLLGFDCVSLGPTEFKELFRRNFGVLLHPRDLGVLVSLYDKRGEERADSTEFLKDFWQIGREGRERQARKRLQMVRSLNAKQHRRLNERAERMSKLKEVAIGQHTEDDVRTAVAKLTEVAERYVVSRDQGFHQLEQGGVMGPTTFREQLRTIFGLRLTRAEVGGLVSAFDLHRDGMIDAKEFAFRFHALGRESHAAKEAEGHARNERVRRRKQEVEDALLAKLREQSKCKINWNFSEEELERGKRMIAKAASTYDKARLGADIDRIAQMKMDPTAFRTQLLQNFRVRLGPGELGAVFTAFDKDNSKLIDGTELMHEFFRMGREERAKNLAAAGRQRHRADQKEMKFRRRLEDRFIEQTAAKVVWPSLTHDPFDDDYSMDDHGTMSLASTASIGCAPTTAVKSGGESSSRQRSLESSIINSSSGGGEPVGRPAAGSSSRRGRRPKISASTAEFLAQIRKEEMTIRAMSTRGRRRRRDEKTSRSNNNNRSYSSGCNNSSDSHDHLRTTSRSTTTTGGTAAAHGSPGRGGAAASGKPPTPTEGRSAAPEATQGDKENAHPGSRRSSASASSAAGDSVLRSHGKVSELGGEPVDETGVLSGSLASRSGSWGVAGGVASRVSGDGGSLGGRSMLQSRGGDSNFSASDGRISTAASGFSTARGSTARSSRGRAGSGGGGGGDSRSYSARGGNLGGMVGFGSERISEDGGGGGGGDGGGESRW